MNAYIYRMNSESKAIRTTWLSIFGNTVIAIIKWIAGYLGNSYGLIADAIESTSDIFASFLALIGLTYAARPADENHPYGHGKAEPIMTFVVVAFLVTSAAIIIYQSILHILTPHDLPESYTLYILGVIIAIKEIFYRIVHKRSKETKSTLLKADAWHHRSDAITSVTVFIGILVALIFGKGYETADDWAALVAGGIILYNSYLIFRPALGEIMDEHVYDDLILEIRKFAKEVDGVIDTEKCYVRKSGLKFYVDLHAIVDGNLSVYHGHEIAKQLRIRLRREFPEIVDVLVHVEPDDK